MLTSIPIQNSLPHPPFNTPFEPRLHQALIDLRNGKPVLLMDDADRENEVDLIAAAETISVPVMAQFIRDGSGIICLCLTDEKLQQLDLPQMVNNNQSKNGTAFTVSIEAKHGVTTGVSAADRVTTILTAVDSNSQPDDLARPGHIFPLRAASGGLLQRRGHTEGAVELAHLAGLKPAGVLVELMNPDGTMARGEDIVRYARMHGLVVMTIEELVGYLQG